MKSLKLIIAIIILVVLSSCSKEPLEEIQLTGKASIEFYENTHTNIVNIESQIIAYINDHRESEGLQPLEKSFTVQKYSDSHTEYMILKGNVSHDDFETRAKSLTAEINGGGVAENVAKGQRTALEVVQAWLNSEGHRKNIDNPIWTNTAVTAKVGDDGKYYFTQIFVKQ